MATIRDIAKACNVSTATVSYVINGKNTLLPETREKVVRMMREMDYHPSAIARGLTNKRMNTLGIQFDNIGSGIAVTHPYSSGILQGVVTSCADAGYNVTIFTELWRSQSESLSKFRDQRADGIIIVAPPSDLDILPSLASASLKVITISANSAPYGIPTVEVDNAGGIRVAINHLLELGHEKIAFISAQPNLYSSKLRLDAFLATFNQLGLSLAPEHIVEASYEGSHTTYEKAQRLLSMANPPTAIVAANDQMAIAVLKAAVDMGISVPRNLSIVGFDDIPDARITDPPLTTVKQPVTEIGVLASKLLLQMLAGEDVPLESIVETSLVVRGSTAQLSRTI